MAENPHLEDAYHEGQLMPGHGVWDREDPHMSYVEFYERAVCFHRRLKRMGAAEYARRSKEFYAMCKDYPEYQKRWLKGDKPNLND